jgi:hypothetical protein
MLHPDAAEKVPFVATVLNKAPAIADFITVSLVV